MKKLTINEKIPWKSLLILKYSLIVGQHEPIKESGKPKEIKIRYITINRAIFIIIFLMEVQFL